MNQFVTVQQPSGIDVEDKVPLSGVKVQLTRL